MTAWKYLLVFLLLLSGCQLHSEPREDEDPLFFLLKRLDVAEKINNRIYLDARKIILAAGWTPMQSITESDDRLSHGAIRDFWNSGCVEIEECAGSQPTFCNFMFTDSMGNKLLVITSGKEPLNRASQAMVTFTQVISDYKPSDGGAPDAVQSGTINR